MNREQELVAILVEAKNAYYADGSSKLTDLAYDNLESELRKINPNSFVLASVGSKDGDIDLVYPMLSTDKSLSIKELQSYWNRTPGCTEYVISQKVDGMATSLKYVQGSLVEATSRGDGKFGKSFMWKAKDIPAYLKNLGNFTGYIRGETHMTDANFIELNRILKEDGAEEMKNSRNAVAGLLNTKDLSRAADKLALLSLMVYGVYDEDSGASIYGSYEKYSDQLKKATEFGFTAVEHKLIKGTEDFTYEMAEQWIHKYAYGNDGLVLRVNNNAECAKFGTDSKVHHLQGVTAFKLKNDRAITVVLGYDWSFGSREISPVVLIEPVELDGATISRVGGHSVKNLVECDARIGQYICLERSGSVIPKMSHRDAFGR